MIEILKVIGIALGCTVAVLLGLVVLYVLFLLVSVLFVNTKKEYETRSNFFENLFSLSAYLACKILLMKVIVTGKEKLPEGRFLFVCNHRSNFDPIITRWAFWKQDISFISKPENFKIPVAKQLMVRCRYLSIDRENPRNSMKTLLKAIDYIKTNQGSIGIYPEGTRSKDGKLLPFHDGIFKVAQKADVPVVVATIVGSENVKKCYPFRRTVIHLDVLDVILPDKTKSSHDISDTVRSLMEDKISEYEGGRVELNEVESSVVATETTE